MNHASMLLRAFRDITVTRGWSLTQWETLIRQARRADVLASLAVRLREYGVLESAPPEARAHLDAATILAQAQERDIRREVLEITAAVEPTGVRPVLLKGAAYLMTGLPVGRGRLFADVDILVPHEHLADVEAALMLRGWVTTHHNAYDQRYYRRWMHELPPMRHLVRQTVLDVHHGILPLTARFRPNPALLLAAALPVTDHGDLRVLAPIDMILHSATHLLCNEEFSHGFRDLLDLDGLTRHFSAGEPQFWTRIARRAVELDLQRVWYYAMRYCARMLGTPIAPDATTFLDRGEPPLIGGMMDALFTRALEVDHPLAANAFSSAARRLLYLRGHWLRMPAHLLAYHLTVKAFRREEEEHASP
ncbi:MAG TPA: nucleotidyltransferase family protein [Burkholderiales bacterium]|nr:nucleotidyltransferase family protein [Burkholderiales bacterium]